MLSEVQVKQIALPILQRELGAVGLSGAQIIFEQDFDGEQIIRIQANLNTPTSRSDKVLASMDAIRAALMEQGDDRFVFVDQASPNAPTDAEDDEESEQGNSAQ